MRAAKAGPPALVLAVIVLAAGTAVSSDLPPRGKRELLQWLQAGTYRERFVGEPGVHPSTAEGRVHGRNVRTYYNTILTDDLRAGRNPFRRGAAMVKELYFDNQDRPIGYSVMIKVRRRSGIRGRGWFFYETLDGTNRAALSGRGVDVCTGCHQSGVDFLRSTFRPLGSS